MTESGWVTIKWSFCAVKAGRGAGGELCYYCKQLETPQCSFPLSCKRRTLMVVCSYGPRWSEALHTAAFWHHGCICSGCQEELQGTVWTLSFNYKAPMHSLGSWAHIVALFKFRFNLKKCWQECRRHLVNSALGDCGALKYHFFRLWGQSDASFRNSLEELFWIWLIFTIFQNHD